MGAYLDRLNREYDEVVAGVDTVIDRAAEENRDVSESESEQVNRDRERLTVLRSEIDRYAGIERESAEVARIRSSLPAPSRTAVRTEDREPEYDIAREFPTIADWAITVHRATALRDTEAPRPD
jgi:hypothetical protein